MVYGHRSALFVNKVFESGSFIILGIFHRLILKVGLNIFNVMANYQEVEFLDEQMSSIIISLVHAWPNLYDKTNELYHFDDCNQLAYADIADEIRKKYGHGITCKFLKIQEKTGKFFELLYIYCCIN